MRGTVCWCDTLFVVRGFNQNAGTALRLVRPTMWLPTNVYCEVNVGRIKERMRRSSGNAGHRVLV